VITTRRVLCSRIRERFRRSGAWSSPPWKGGVGGGCRRGTRRRVPGWLLPCQLGSRARRCSIREYGPAFAPQPFVTYHVAFRLRVLPAVDLNDELCLAAGEICDVRADRKLSREPGPIARQQMPDFAFLRGGRGTQRSCASGECGFYALGHCLDAVRGALCAPTPSPSLPGRGTYASISSSSSALARD
jgi:hypothetical protein